MKLFGLQELLLLYTCSVICASFLSSHCSISVYSLVIQPVYTSFIHHAQLFSALEPLSGGPLRLSTFPYPPPPTFWMPPLGLLTFNSDLTWYFINKDSPDTVLTFTMSCIFSLHFLYYSVQNTFLALN